MSKYKLSYTLLPYFAAVISVFLLLQFGLYRQFIGPSNTTDFIDTDAFMRLVRVEQLADTGDWYDSVIHRSNYPYGEDLHWTRPLDILLIAGAWICTPFLGFHEGLALWGFIISPLLGIITLAALFWATRHVLSQSARYLLGLLFITQTVLLQAFAFGRPDHHGLLLMLFVLLLGCVFRILNDPASFKYANIAGFIAAFSMWVSIETIFSVILVYIVLSFYWLTDDKTYARQMLYFSINTLIFSSVFLLLERPLSSLLVIEYDKISIVHLYVFFLAALASYVLTLIKDTSPSVKMWRAVMVFASCCLAIWIVFPAFYQGPMAGVSRAIVPIWLDNVAEVQPLWSLAPYHLTVIIGSAILFLMYWIYTAAAHRFPDRRDLHVALLCGFILFLPLGVYQVRWCNYLLVTIEIGLAALAGDIIAAISNSRIREVYKPLLRVQVVLLFILLLPVTGLLVSPGGGSENNAIKPDVTALTNFLNHYQQTNPQALTILAYVDLGPELLYRTNYNVIATPYHRNDQGILYLYDVMTQENPVEVDAMLAERSVDLVILCPESAEKKFSKNSADHSTFYRYLLSDKIPDFLEEVEPSAGLREQFKIFRVIS